MEAVRPPERRDPAQRHDLCGRLRIQRGCTSPGMEARYPDRKPQRRQGPLPHSRPARNEGDERRGGRGRGCERRRGSRPEAIGEAHRRSGPLRARKTYARSMYAPSLVLTLIFSPELTKGGTWTISPVSVLAGLNEVVTVAFLMLGSVSVTVSTTEGGSSTPIGRSL